MDVSDTEARNRGRQLFHLLRGQRLTRWRLLFPFFRLADLGSANGDPSMVTAMPAPIGNSYDTSTAPVMATSVPMGDTYDASAPVEAEPYTIAASSNSNDPANTQHQDSSVASGNEQELASARKKRCCILLIVLIIAFAFIIVPRIAI